MTKVEIARRQLGGALDMFLRGKIRFRCTAWRWLGGLYELMDVKETASRILGRKTDIMSRRSLHRASHPTPSKSTGASVGWLNAA